jgi:hypothetical protein
MAIYLFCDPATLAAWGREPTVMAVAGLLGMQAQASEAIRSESRARRSRQCRPAETVRTASNLV